MQPKDIFPSQLRQKPIVFGVVCTRKLRVRNTDSDESVSCKKEVTREQNI